MLKTSSAKERSEFKISLGRDLHYIKAWLFVFPLIILFISAFLGFFVYIQYNGLTGSLSDVTQSIDIFMITSIGYLAAVLTIPLSFSSYRFLFSRRKTDYFCALPIKRKTQFLSKTVAGAIVIFEGFLAAILSSVVLMIVFKIQEGLTISFYNIFAKFLVAFLCVGTVFIMSNLCAVSSGKLWHFLLLCFGIIGVFPSIITSILGNIYDLTAGASTSLVSYGMYFNPFNMIQNLQEEQKNHLRFLILSAVLLSVLYFVLGLKVYLKRKNECSEQSISGKIALSMVFIGLQIDAFSLFSFKAKNYLIALLISLAVAFVYTIICSLIYTKRPFRKVFMLEFMVVSIAMSLLMIISANGLFGFSNTVPEVENVEKAVIISNRDTGERTMLSSLISAKEDLYDDDTIYPGNYTFTSADTIKKIEGAQRKYISDFKEHTSLDMYTYTTVKYFLKNGKTITRSYPEINDYSYIYRASEEYKNNIPFIKDYTEDDLLFISNSDGNTIKSVGYNDIKGDILRQNELSFKKIIKVYQDSPCVLSLNVYFVNSKANEAQKAEIKKLTYKQIVDEGMGDDLIDVQTVYLTSGAKNTLGKMESEKILSSVVPLSQVKENEILGMYFAGNEMLYDASDSLFLGDRLLDTTTYCYCENKAECERIYNSIDDKNLKNQIGIAKNDENSGSSVSFILTGGRVTELYYTSLTVQEDVDDYD